MFEAAEDVVAEAVAERGRVVGCPELDGGSNDWAEKKEYKTVIRHKKLTLYQLDTVQGIKKESFTLNRWLLMEQ